MYICPTLKIKIFFFGELSKYMCIFGNSDQGLIFCHLSSTALSVSIPLLIVPSIDEKIKPLNFISDNTKNFFEVQNV